VGEHRQHTAVVVGAPGEPELGEDALHVLLDRALSDEEQLGHALGLGHAQPLTESTDLMGYGWHWSNGIVPTLSECDLSGIAVVFAWALEGVDPYPPTQPSVACD
jgi:hypothetical protein